ncbi:hypothetical protein [Paenibacillus dendritiformis]|uniref:hypothetical protein n=1 Tax=Paenibacillus dendritiformis TaxID=130049 RepID=UPI001F555B5D|nr:hypothetical protein [Paenibacillus dendritiformis]
MTPLASATRSASAEQQWNETVALAPDWILNLDADETFEHRFGEVLRPCLAHPEGDVYCFRLYDMWSSTHDREDDYWHAHRYYRRFLVRYRAHFAYTWKEQALHCGRTRTICSPCPTAQ